MTKLTSFEKDTVRQIGERIQQLINSDPQLQALGVTGAYRGGRYESLQADIKIQVSIQAADGESPSAARFRQFAAVYGMESGWLGKRFANSRAYWEIVGLRNRRSEYIVECKRLDTGRVFLMKPEHVIGGMAIAPAGGRVSA